MLTRTAAFLVLATSATAQSNDTPLSAIDWLSQPTLAPITTPTPQSETGVAPQEIEVMELDGPAARTVGLIPAPISGIPLDFWADQANDTPRLAQKLRLNASLPAGHDLMVRILLSEAEGDNQLISARARALIDRGAVAAAFNLLGQVQFSEPANFAAYVDAALLNAQYDPMCSQLLVNRALSTDDALYVFCLSRSNQWDKAVLNFFSLDTLDAFTPGMASLLAADLDPELADQVSPSPVDPQSLGALEFRLRESVGLSVPTQGLPLKFAPSDLRDVVGWKAQLDATERLASVGSLPATQLIETYSRGRKSASGGVWERVGVVQDFVDETNINPDYEALWNTSHAAGLASVVARGLATVISNTPARSDSQTTRLKFLVLAQKADLSFGELAQAFGVDGDEKVSLIREELAKPLEVEAPLQSGQVLDALAMVAEGLEGDFNSFLSAVKLFRMIGMQPIAEQLAAEYLVLDLVE